MLQNILFNIFAINLFLTRCFYPELEKNIRISNKSLLRKPENMNFRLCSIKYENFVIKKHLFGLKYACFVCNRE